MTNDNPMQIVKDLPNKKITITRNFDASPDQVWSAWTESELLDQWWAPKPWRTETKSMNFNEGGYWLYAMIGPDKARQWARVDFITIDHLKSFTATDSFCDENGNINSELPGMNWRNEFHVSNGGTTVIVEISFNNLKDLEKLIEMGFETGFTLALENLNELLKK